MLHAQNPIHILDACEEYGASPANEVYLALTNRTDAGLPSLHGPSPNPAPLARPFADNKGDIITPDFDLTNSKEVAKAFLYTAENSDYHYLRALCNPFVGDYADIAQGQLGEFCYWLPRYGRVDQSLDDLKSQFKALGNYELADEQAEEFREGGQLFARVQLLGVGEDSSQAGPILILQKIGRWWFLHRWEE